MKKTYILGNWKSNKTLAEAIAWKQQFAQLIPSLPSDISVIVCPAFHHLPIFEEVTSYAIGVQDISPFESGAVTGAISAEMVRGVAAYALLGHSERRTKFGETDDVVAEKVIRVLAIGIKPIVCISTLDHVNALHEKIPDFGKTGMLLYEPLFAIGSGNADSPENANSMARKISRILPVPILYGGSVMPDNAKGFVNTMYLSGVGVGGASLNAEKFSQIINAVI